MCTADPADPAVPAVLFLSPGSAVPVLAEVSRGEHDAAA